MDLLGLAFNFLRLCRTSFELSVVDRISAFCDLGRDLLLLLLNPYHIISTVTTLQASAQPEVTCLFCVLRDEHQSIDRPVCPIF